MRSRSSGSAGQDGEGIRVVPARIDDLGAIVDIYNEAILTTVATMDTERVSVDAKRPWFLAHGKRHPLLLALAGGETVGWASLSPWSPKRGYDGTAEISIYVKEASRGRGIGTKLLRSVLQAGQEAGLRTVLARIAGGNGTSVRMHEREGFITVGVMKEVGEKFGRRIDVHLMQRTIHPGAPERSE